VPPRTGPACEINPDVLVRELAGGTTTMAQLPLAMPPRVPAGEPLSFSLGSDGHGYVVAVATELQRVPVHSDRHRPIQSRSDR
jgi:hypothetical protein